MLVAEATLLDKQLRALCVCSDEALLAASALDQENFPSGSSGPSSLTMSSARCSISTSALLPLADISQIDSDELTLVSNKVLDLKTRLGLLSSGNRGKEVDWGSLGEFAQETGNKVKLGFNFYQDGTRLLVNDLQVSPTSKSFKVLKFSILVQCVLFHVEWCIRQPALISFYHIL